MTGFRYSSRPAKHVVRILLAEACRRITPIAEPATYRYVGLGGLEFTDFVVFRKTLGITRMVSIERDTHRFARYEFNKPFGGIELLGGTVSDRLTDIPWDPLSIVWLDYEGQVTLELLADLSFTCHEVVLGSILIVTANASSPKPVAARRRQLVKNVGEERIPPGTTNQTLAQWGWASAQRQILLGAVDEELSRRRDGARFAQLFDFWYADDAPMQTFGGLVISDALSNALAACHFENLFYVRQRG